MVHDLINVMKAMVSMHKKLNDLAIDKQNTVKKGDIKALERVMKEEAPIVQQLRKLENTRMHLIDRWQDEKGLVKEAVTMDQLLPLFPEKERTELEDWSVKLIEEMIRLKEQNDLNEQLLEDSLRFVNVTLDSMRPQNTYNNYSGTGPSGDEDDFRPGDNSLFDSKA
ncbi:flagellar protein FlgN [Salisediminibacterium selenitireducens]|uniref:FlgN family protein n=1 Tax=Bacillus selenitireducens (strain ATCC 700615 / DSM 15326 / MLS10) TaxID=439292 RepID=D6Y0F5_BACIE|nr:flagellar protein FlgN [Salisediminibacterium selenitireducens]ADH98546.1 FlgN family protein [[Bacillus] selenitireducens MLS10]